MKSNPQPDLERLCEQFGFSNDVRNQFDRLAKILSAEGELIWSDGYDIAANGYPGVGDFDGDKATE